MTKKQKKTLALLKKARTNFFKSEVILRLAQRAHRDCFAEWFYVNRKYREDFPEA